MKPNPDAAPAAPRKPRLALAIATCFGLGYIPLSAGTWGSLVGAVVVLGVVAPFLTRFEAIFGPFWQWLFGHAPSLGRMTEDVILYAEILVAIGIALIGTWAAHRATRYLQVRDPQQVVIDEVSGMGIALLLGLGLGVYPLSTLRNPDFVGYGYLFMDRVLNWKYLLLGFILFRVFDIWKPFPVRQAEKLPGGWGIMADDWVAAVYAALGLWVARYLGL